MLVGYIVKFLAINEFYFPVDDEDKIREELKDLIDDNPIEESEGEDSDASGGSKKRKKSDDEDEDLEDDDYDLLEENLGMPVERVSNLNIFLFFFIIISFNFILN